MPGCVLCARRQRRARKSSCKSVVLYNVSEQPDLPGCAAADVCIDGFESGVLKNQRDLLVDVMPDCKSAVVAEVF